MLRAFQKSDTLKKADILQAIRTETGETVSQTVYSNVMRMVGQSKGASWALKTSPAPPSQVRDMDTTE